MTEAEFLALEDKRVEWVNGEVIFMSPVSLSHALVMSWIVERINRIIRPLGKGVVFPDSVAVRLGYQLIRVPDVAYVSLERARILKDTYIDGPPDLIVEVVSAESRSRDYREKYHEYLAAGVQEYWIVDPLYHAVDAYRLTGTPGQRTYQPIVPVKPDSQSEIVELRSEVLPGFVLRPEWLKQTPLPISDT
jgi:Uma2 family endonuclease